MARSAARLSQGLAGRGPARARGHRPQAPGAADLRAFWNHTTLHALRIDSTITYLQVLYPPPDTSSARSSCTRSSATRSWGHLELVRYGGQIPAFGLPIVRFASEQRLDEIIRQHGDHGCPIFNPHAFTLEEGGMRQVDYSHLAFKRQADPLGHLSPGKMLAWDNLDYAGTTRQSYLYKSLA